ncbi:hypothetical protein G3M83_07100 [Rouxiella badensis]|uniref:hypothetical protein n=1 Tax=Rouxiella badensis TaxID=1646377 RepID=UPI0013EF30AE|nr:hypothetical protein [Rouxiella badensis]QII37480.1 hypothetical protein G3M83_07100 [Rouxiella badensis]
MPTLRRLGEFPRIDINDTQVQASVKIDDGCDHTARIIWAMNNKRRMSTGLSIEHPDAPQVAPVKIEPIKKPRKRGYSVVEKAIGAE